MPKEAPLPSIQKLTAQLWSKLVISLPWLKACNSSITRREKPLLDGTNILPTIAQECYQPWLSQVTGYISCSHCSNEQIMETCINSVGKFYPSTSNDNVGTTQASSSPSHAHFLKASPSYVCFYCCCSHLIFKLIYEVPVISTTVCRSAAWLNHSLPPIGKVHQVTLRPKL